MKRPFYRLISLLAALCLTIGIVPFGVAVAEKDSPVATVEDVLPEVFASSDGPEYYGREALGRMSNGRNLVFAYDKIAEGIANRAENISLFRLTYSLLSLEEIQTVYDAYRYDHAEIYYLDNSYGFQYNASNKVTAFLPKYVSLDADETLQQALNSLFDQSGVTENMSDYEKALRLHDVLCAHVEYDRTLVSDYIHTAYGALVNGLAVCDGYTKAYQLLLRKAGISSHEVTGDAGGGHAWNLVKLDGEYYYTDVTWDDQSEVYYAYFNLTKARMDEDHTLDIPAYGLPECTATAANYYSHNVGKFDLNTDPKDLVGAIEDNRMVRLYYTGDETNVSTITNWIFGNKRVFSDAMGLTGSIKASMTYMSREYHMTLTQGTTTVAIPSAPALTYTGSIQTGVLASANYTLSGTYRATNAGTYKATLSLKSNCQWSDGTTADKQITWSIHPKSVTKYNLSVSDIPHQVYTGEAIYPTVTLSCDGLTMTEGTDYTLKVIDNIQPGQARITLLSGDSGNFIWAEELFFTFQIVKPVTPPTAVEGLVFTGEEQIGVPEGSGYTLTGHTATDAGEHMATLTLWDNHVWTDGTTGDKTIYWRIAQRRVTAEDLTLTPIPDQEYTGEEICPTFTVVWGDLTLEPHRDYLTVYGNNTYPGEAYIALSPTTKGNFTWEGTITLPFQIVIYIPLPQANFLVYTGQYQTGVPSGDGYDITGENSAADTGEYAATLTLRDGYRWEDGSKEPQTVIWRITKAAGEVTLSVTEKGALDPRSNSGGNITYRYYTNETCTEGETTTPAIPGDYWVVAVLAETKNYTAAKSEPVKISLTAPPIETPSWGRVDNDEDVTASDALLALQAATGKVILDEIHTRNADVDGSGGLTASDALLILQYATKKISKFPVEG